MPHYFDEAPDAPSRPGHVDLRLPDLSVSLAVDRGVFSSGAVDTGTLALLRLAAPAPPAGSDVLDLGCGYGPIAVALATRWPRCTVWAVDVNTRALALSTANATRLGLTNVRAATPESVPAGVTFTSMWSNPPIRIGKDALHALLLSWLPRLSVDPPGEAWLVVQRHLGADSLASWLSASGWAVTRVGSKKGYRLLRVSHPVAPAAQPVAGAPQ